jgi:hypothetical protein
MSAKLEERKYGRQVMRDQSKNLGSKSKHCGMNDHADTCFLKLKP